MLGMMPRQQVQACDEAHPTMMRPDSSSTMMLARPVRLMIRPTTVTPEQMRSDQITSLPGTPGGSDASRSTITCISTLPTCKMLFSAF